jgi:hypothetical protein
MKILTFLGPNATPKLALALLPDISEPPKVLIYRAHPFQWALEMDLPPSKSLHPAPCKQQVYFNSYKKSAEI